ncbi:MAG: hypothetical protein EA412_11245 [Chitinophagaceae bacterium]|nr:MAG: hypothetical protein EA412_11245 [Chitinophagaceae bacterium]
MIIKINCFITVIELIAPYFVFRSVRVNFFSRHKHLIFRLVSVLSLVLTIKWLSFTGICLLVKLLITIKYPQCQIQFLKSIMFISFLTTNTAAKNLNMLLFNKNQIILPIPYPLLTLLFFKKCHGKYKEYFVRLGVKVKSLE